MNYGNLRVKTMQTLLTISEAAARLRVSKSMIYLLAERQEIPHFRVGRRILFDESQLEAYLGQHVVGVAVTEITQ